MIAAMDNKSRNAVVTLIPPPVDPEDAPININAIV